MSGDGWREFIGDTLLKDCTESSGDGEIGAFTTFRSISDKIGRAANADEGDKWVFEGTAALDVGDAHQLVETPFVGCVEDASATAVDSTGPADPLSNTRF